jgi:hypothetical protein
MKQIVIYPGKFQPFCRHHYKVYEHLCKQFPESDVYIITSNKEAPYNFNDKKLVMLKFGIPLNRIICEKNPYSPEFVKNFDVDATQMICAYSDKDSGRLSYVKKDGTSGYYQALTTEMAPLSKHGYVYIIPKISVLFKGNEMSGTFVRNYLKYCTEEDFIDLFGWWDESIYQILKSKLKLSMLEDTIVGNIGISKKIKIAEEILNTNSAINISRDDMPQIDNINDLITWLNLSGINNYTGWLNTCCIKLTQSTIDDEKVKDILSKKMSNEIFIVSNDDYLVDGHHRFVANRLKYDHAFIDCLVIDMPIMSLITKLKEYPNIKHKKI